MDQVENSSIAQTLSQTSFYERRKEAKSKLVNLLNITITEFCNNNNVLSLAKKEVKQKNIFK